MEGPGGSQGNLVFSLASALRLILALIPALLAIGLLPHAANAGADFSASKVETAPTRPHAGDVVRYGITVLNSGSATNYARVSTTLPSGFLINAEGDCAGASGATEQLLWHEGGFAGGATRRCLLTVLTRRDAAGTSANVATEINAPPTTYHRVDSNVELKTPPDPHQVRLGPVAATRAGVAVLLVLVIFLAGIPVAIVRAKQLKARGRGGIAEGPVGLVGAWAALVIGSGFLLVFAALGWEDWRSYADYRATTCNVFGSTVQSFTGGTRRTGRSYRPLFAVRYDVAGVGTYSSGYGPSSTFNFNTASSARATFERFVVGSSHPCWYDPQDPKTVLLARGPGGAYLFALFPLPVLALALFVMSGGRRRSVDRCRSRLAN